jgi:type IV secretory pathway TraG/TraD family ATPase VirD4
MPNDLRDPITFFARTNFRNQGRVFGIRQSARRAHMYVIGKTGTGKSTLLETMIRQDLAQGRGVALFDPHGDLVERVLERIPEKRKDDLVYFNVPDIQHPLGFNPLESVPPAKRSVAASALLEVFKKIWPDSWGPRLEHILRNALLALLDQPEATLADVLRLFHDKEFRIRAAERTSNAQVRAFWLHEFEKYPVNLRAEAISPIQNKVGAFLANPLLNRILTQKRSSFNLRALMDEDGILLVNLSKGKIGEDAAALLGAMLVANIGLTALSRADSPERSRRDFHLYLDEFQTFTTLSLVNMLSELRKYHVNLILAHQYLAQVEEEVRDAILGNVGTIITFRLGFADAELLAQEFYPEFTQVDLVSLPNYHVYLKLMVDGKVTTPFSAESVMLREWDRMDG